MLPNKKVKKIFVTKKNRPRLLIAGGFWVKEGGTEYGDGDGNGKSDSTAQCSNAFSGDDVQVDDSYDGHLISHKQEHQRNGASCVSQNQGVGHGANDIFSNIDTRSDMIFKFN